MSRTALPSRRSNITRAVNWDGHEFSEVLKYEPETGKIWWRDQVSRVGFNARWCGREAFASVHRDGYLQGRALGRAYLAHRVAWLLHYGSWPVGDIDHVNGNRQDNRIVNLRQVNRQQNAQNAKVKSTNKSGHIGVYWKTRNRKWAAAVCVDGRNMHLGLFDDIQDAIAARVKAQSDLGFHPNHGRPE